MKRGSVCWVAVRCAAFCCLLATVMGRAAEVTTPEQQYQKVLRDTAKQAGISVADLEKQIEQAGGVYDYFMNRYLAGKLPILADAITIVALSKGIQPMPIDQSVLSENPNSIAALLHDPVITVKEISYRSSIDNVGPLYAEVVYNALGKHMPIVVIQHGGNPGSRFGTVPSCYRMAQNGMFAISVSKRARDGSAGEGDSWATEIFDIIDAIEYVKLHYTANVDPTNVNIWGYSGGSIDSIAAATRFPDYFRCIAPFFGQFEWTTTFAGVPREQRRKHAAAGEKQKINAIVDGIGGYPDEVPNNYMARDNMAAVVNNPYSRIHLILDEKDPSGQNLQRHFREYYKKAQELGYTNVEFHLSKVGDTYRFHHDYPGTWAQLGNPDLMFAESFFVPHILSGDYPRPILADAGILHVLGYVKTRRFFVWLDKGNNAVAQLEYALGDHENSFRFQRLSSDANAKGRLVFPNPDGYPFQVTVNDNTVVEKTTSKEVKVEFSLDDRIVISRMGS